MHAIDASRLDPMTLILPRFLHMKNVWAHSPTWKKKTEIFSMKCGAVLRYCVTAPIILPGPTNPWALQLATPLPRGAPQRHLRGPAWPPATCPRHLRIAWATSSPATWPHCRVAFARWSRAPCQLACHVIRGVCGIKKTPFFNFFNYRIHLKIK